MANASCGRLTNLLLQPEIERRALEPPAPGNDLAVSLGGAGFGWKADGEVTLPSISVEVPRGTLTVLVGELGSRKSSVLAAILGEMQEVSARGRVCGPSGWCTAHRSLAS